MKKVLIVEDEEFLYKIFESKLRSSETDVVVAKNGQIALDELNKNKFDLVLLDLILPVMDGFDVLAEMKKNDSFKNIPVIITSNLSQSEDMKKAMSLGAVDYIVKSNTSISGIVETVQKYLQ